MSSSVPALTEHLLSLLARHSLQHGTFTLSSGGQASYYIDARLTTMRPEGLTTIGQLALGRFQETSWEPTAVGGLTLGADPVAYAIAYASASTSTPIRAFTVRKEPKAHGTKQQIEGPLLPTDRVVIVEDVLTTGASALRAADAVRSFGAEILGVLGVVDREQGARERLQDAGLTVLCLTNVSQLLAYK
jgi:orotate phosphoribosyltransferase